MLKFFAVLALLAASLMPACPHRIVPPASTALEHQHLSTHSILFHDVLESSGGKCSATAVGPSALLTAQHCFLNTNKVFLDGSKKPTIILAVLTDGNDHVIYLVDAVFGAYASIDQRALRPLEPVHMWGNPLKLTNIYRDGYFRRMTKESWDGIAVSQEFILPCYPGDSGSAIFDENGLIVAVVTGGKGIQEYSPPLAFTDDQLDLAAGR